MIVVGIPDWFEKKGEANNSAKSPKFLAESILFYFSAEIAQRMLNSSSFLCNFVNRRV
jgi:hypothetical protein